MPQDMGEMTGIRQLCNLNTEMTLRKGSGEAAPVSVRHAADQPHTLPVYPGRRGGMVYLLLDKV